MNYSEIKNIISNKFEELNSEISSGTELYRKGNGNTYFRGFYGKYKLTVNYEGKTKETVLDLKKNGINEFDIVV